MSYNNIRKNNGISEKRNAFSSASDSVGTILQDKFDGGCVFSEDISSVPENASSFSLNMQSVGNSLCTRNITDKISLGNAQYNVEIPNLLYSLRSEDLATGGDITICDDYGEDGSFNGILCDYYYHDLDESLPDIDFYSDPNMYFSKYLENGTYIMRIFSEWDKLHIYIRRGSLDVCAQTVFTHQNNCGEKYADVIFTASDIASYTILVSFVRPDEDTYSGNGDIRFALINKTQLDEKGVSESDIADMDFREASELFEKTVDIPEIKNDAELLLNGKYVFKRGEGLYSFDIENGVCRKIASGLSETESSVIFHANGKIILVTGDGKTYGIDDMLRSAEAERGKIYIPTLYSVSDTQTSSKTVEYDKMNVITEYFYIKLLPSNYGTFELPKNLLIDGDYFELYDPLTMEPKNNSCILNANADGGASVKVTVSLNGIILKLRLKKDPTGFFTDYDVIEKCKKLFFSPAERIVFPSAVDGKSNMICYGEKYVSVFNIKDNLYIPPSDMLLWENSEDITAVVRYSDEYLIFSKNYIKRMTIIENTEDVRFSALFKNFKYDSGCDMPKSAVCADDKIIYANSKGGVFYIDRFGFSEKDMSRCVSGNILTGTNGFLSHTEEELKNAEATVCDGKYFLHIGDIFYVWDFLYAVPRSSVAKAS
ncbi:MAG: hypothetical protein ACI4QR_06880, partial [Eubacteriales bacterium]